MASLLHKRTVLYKFVDSISHAIRISLANSTYPESSRMFLNCCDNLAKQTLEFIEKSVPTDKEGAEEILALVGYAWTLVHSFIKRVMDADILQLPYSLTTFIDQQIRGLSGYDNLRIAFESIPDVNYLQERHTRLRKFISFLSEFLAKNAPDNSFSFVGLPFSQNNRLVTNCLLWHEVGHLIAEESNIFGTNKITKIEPQIVLTTCTVYFHFRSLTLSGANRLCRL